MSNMRNLLILLILAIVLVGCSTADPTQEASAPAREIKVRFDWIHTIEYAGFYLAEDNGYFAEENLSVELIPIQEDSRSIEALANGEVDFALTGADEVLLNREAGQDVVAIAAIYQRLPVAFISLASSGIVVPADMSGKSVLLSMGRSPEYAFRALMQATGVDISTVEIVPRELFDESQLLNGEIDISGVFVTNQLVQLNRDGIEVNVIHPVDYGVEMYVNVIATTDELIEEDPELVQGFIRAVVRGMQDAVANPETATDATLTRNPDLNRDSELASMNSSLPLMNPTGSEPGMMSADTWAFTYDMLSTQGILTQAQNIEDAYDLQFLNAVYGS